MSRPLPDFRDLSIAERVQLVEDIWDSIVVEAPESVPLSAPQREELRRRLAAHDSDPATAIAWESVRADLLKREH